MIDAEGIDVMVEEAAGLLLASSYEENPDNADCLLYMVAGIRRAAKMLGIKGFSSRVVEVFEQKLLEEADLWK